MEGACIFCGQVRMFDETKVDDAFVNEFAMEYAAKSDQKVCDHIASCLCDCLEGREYAYRFTARQNAYEDIQYLCNDKEEVVPVAKSAADLILEGAVQSVTFKWEKVQFRVLKGKDSLKVEKTITTKESLES